MSPPTRFTNEQVSTGHNALMDWSSFFKLTEPQSVMILQQRLTSPGDPVRFRENLTPFLIDIIARLVVYDALLLDINVQETFLNPLSAEAVRIAPIQFDAAVYRSAADTTFQCLHSLRNTTVKMDPYQLLEVDDFFLGDLDQSLPYYPGGQTIVNGKRSVTRAIFYLELSRHLGLQLFLSYEKRDLLMKLQKLFWQDAFSVVSTTIDSAMKKNQPIALENDVRMQTPPVVDLVIRRALDRKISLEQSIIEVRNVQGAQQFRDLLAQVQRLMMVGDAAAMLKVNHILAPLLKAANTWSTAADPGVRWMWQARVSKLPWIGALLETLGVEVPEIAVKGSYGSYVQFVSEWYNCDSSETSKQ